MSDPMRDKIAMLVALAICDYNGMMYVSGANEIPEALEAADNIRAALEADPGRLPVHPEHWDIAKDHILKFAEYVLRRGGLDPSSDRGDEVVLRCTVQGVMMPWDYRDDRDPLTFLTNMLRTKSQEGNDG